MVTPQFDTLLVNCPSCHNLSEVPTKDRGMLVTCACCSREMRVPLQGTRGLKLEDDYLRPAPSPLGDSLGSGKSTRIKCPHCAAPYDVMNTFLGRRIQCTACREAFIIPQCDTVRLKRPVISRTGPDLSD